MLILRTPRATVGEEYACEEDTISYVVGGDVVMVMLGLDDTGRSQRLGGSDDG